MCFTEKKNKFPISTWEPNECLQLNQSKKRVHEVNIDDSTILTQIKNDLANLRGSLSLNRSINKQLTERFLIKSKQLLDQNSNQFKPIESCKLQDIIDYSTNIIEWKSELHNLTPEAKYININSQQQLLGDFFQGNRLLPIFGDK